MSPALALPASSLRNDQRPLVLGLVVALLAHSALVLVPLEFMQRVPLEQSTFQVEIVRAPAPSTTESTSIQTATMSPTPKHIERAEKLPAAMAQPTKTDQAPPQSPPKDTTPKANEPTPVTTPVRPKESTTAQPQIESGAKSRSTIFDPRVVRRLEVERNRVQKFESRDANFATEHGVFMQRGNSCWKFRKLSLDGGSESSVTQRFNINCAQRSRSQEDIDRLAEKYGIP